MNLVYNFEDYINYSMLFLSLQEKKHCIKSLQKEYQCSMLESGLFDIYKRKKWVEYEYSEFLSCRLTELSCSEEDYLYLNILYDMDDHSLFLLEQVYNAHRQKVLRLKDKITDMLNENCVFLTLTFTDDVLDSTNDNTRRRYVNRFLKSQSNCFIANIDFGQDDKFTKREHYHALIVSDKVDYSLWNYGIINGQKVVVNNPSALAKYINKITYHCYKKGASSTRLIYSRKKIINFDKNV